MLSWIAYSLVFGALVSLAAWLAEQGVSGRPVRRFVWVCALVLTAGWPLYTLHGRAPVPAFGLDMPFGAALFEAAGPLPGTSGTGAAARASAAADAAEMDALVEAGGPLRATSLAVLLWLLASVVCVGRLLRSLAATRRLARSCRPAVIAGQRVLVSPRLGPAVIGIRAPQVVVPEWLLSLPASARSLVLEHEREHLRARDAYVRLAGQLATAALPWHPAVWWQAARLNLGLELDCDARVLRRTTVRSYGDVLLAVGTRRCERAPAGAYLLERATMLERRIREMTKQRRSRAAAAAAALCALVLLSAGFALRNPQATAPAAPVATGSLTGLVTDANGAPIRGAEVQVLNTRFAAVTNADGAFRIAGIPAGTYQLRVARSDFAAVEIEAVVIRTDETTRRDIGLPETAAGTDRPAVVARQLREAAAETVIPLDSVVVTTLGIERARSEQRAGFAQQSWSAAKAIALDAVIVTALGIERGERTLGYAVQRTSAAGQTRDAETSQARRSGGTVAGTVVDDAGAPVVNAQVLLPDLRAGALTNAQGRFLLLGVGPGTHALHVRASGLDATRVGAVEVEAGATITTRIQMSAAPLLTVITERPATTTPLRGATGDEATAAASGLGTITGRVLDAGRPVPNAQVTAAGTRLGAVTNADGNFLMLNVPAGTYTLRVQSPGGPSLELADVVVTGGRSTARCIQLRDQTPHSGAGFTVTC